MAFRFKDLMINVVSEEAERGPRRAECLNGCSTGFSACGHGFSVAHCGTISWFCGGVSLCGGCSASFCGDWTGRTCPGGSHICGPSIFPTYREVADFGATDLHQLRAQLEKALVEVAEEERRQAAALRPQSRSEAEELESKLKEALAELQRQKGELK
jgi:hypothetical protein